MLQHEWRFLRGEPESETCERLQAALSNGASCHDGNFLHLHHPCGSQQPRVVDKDLRCGQSN